MKTPIHSSCLGVSATVGLRLASVPALALDGAELYQRAQAASVEVLVGGQQAGSGWFADAEGLVITAAHGVRDPQATVEVLSRGVGRLPAEVLAVDRGHDIALLRVPASEAPYPFLRVAEEVPQPGADVFLFGGAFFRHELLIRGNMARAEPTFEYLAGQQCYTRVYHISAPSPPGTSGGCWLDTAGQVIGNQSAFLSKDDIGMGIALAASPDAIARLVRTQTSAATPTLGCGLEEMLSQPPSFIAQFPAGTMGLLPVLLVAGGPAETAGLVGDRAIVSVDGTSVAYRDDLLRIVRAKQPGEKITLTTIVPDSDEPQMITLTLGRLEQETVSKATE